MNQRARLPHRALGTSVHFPPILPLGGEWQLPTHCGHWPASGSLAPMAAVLSWLAGSFLIAAAVSGRTMRSAVIAACAVPVAGVVAALAYLEFFVAAVPQNSTAPIILPWALALSILGGVPGAVAGWSAREWAANRRLR